MYTISAIKNGRTEDKATVDLNELDACIVRMSEISDRIEIELGDGGMDDDDEHDF